MKAAEPDALLLAFRFERLLFRKSGPGEVETYGVYSVRALHVFM